MSKKTDSEVRITHGVKASKVKTNDLMGFVYFAKVHDHKPTNLKVKSIDHDFPFEVHGTELIERGLSADQYEEEIQTTKTKAAEILISSYNKPFTVCFAKSNGEDRVLRGRLVTPEPLLGRSMCEDLDIIDKNRLRLVDHRTIQYLIVEGVKYIVR